MHHATGVSLWFEEGKLTSFTVTLARLALSWPVFGRSSSLRNVDLVLSSLPKPSSIRSHTSCFRSKVIHAVCRTRFRINQQKQS
jgi:hypothetical protein